MVLRSDMKDWLPSSLALRSFSFLSLIRSSACTHTSVDSTEHQSNIPSREHPAPMPIPRPMYFPLSDSLRSSEIRAKAGTRKQARATNSWEIILCFYTNNRRHEKEI